MPAVGHTALIDILAQKKNETFGSFKVLHYLCIMNARKQKARQQRATLNNQLEAAEMTIKHKEKVKMLNAWKSDMLTDLAKLVFAGVIIGGIFEKVEEPFLLYGTGIVVFAICIILGYSYYKRSI
ncbi:MAG: hypothetical protein J6E48_12655 [Prevotella sp.]|nr:hypothetical protein [Prevotella sp.]